MSVVFGLLLCVGAFSGALGRGFLVRPCGSVCLDPVYSETVHTHWVWNHNSNNTQQSAVDLVEGYLSRNIRVGLYNIDSKWATGFNDFLFDSTKFPDAKSMIADFHSRGIKVIAWLTSFIDTDSPNFAEAKAKGVLIKPDEPLKWWHGTGNLVDLENPAAAAWWYSQVQKGIDVGLDGFKADAGDPYIMLYPSDWAKESWDKYKNLYYGGLWNYTVSQKQGGPLGAILMSRPVDCLPAGTGLTHFEFSPRYSLFSGWVGDQDPDFGGLKVALGNFLDSAKHNYVSFGTDTGGYRSSTEKYGPLGRTKTVFVRWAQFSAFCPLFENGGAGEHRPWEFDAETLKIYASFVDIHYQLSPYLYAAGTAAWYDGSSIVKPIDYQYEYMLGSQILVAPIVDEDASSISVYFPTHADSWVDYFNTSKSYGGGSTQRLDYSQLTSFPVFVQKGSVIPMYDTSRPDLDVLVFKIYVPEPGMQQDAIAHAHKMKVHVEVTDDYVLSVEVSQHDSQKIKICVVLSDVSEDICSQPVVPSLGAVYALHILSFKSEWTLL
eukprot:ANDGO_00952.mRNA.1 Alpha-xylosidase